MSGTDERRDDELSRRYRALPPELPLASTDAAIQAAARHALRFRQRSRQRVWLGGLAMAASVTLMMAVLLPSWRSGDWREQVQAHAPVEAVGEAGVEEGFKKGMEEPQARMTAPDAEATSAAAGKRVARGERAIVPAEQRVATPSSDAQTPDVTPAAPASHVASPAAEAEESLASALSAPPPPPVSVARDDALARESVRQEKAALAEQQTAKRQPSSLRPGRQPLMAAPAADPAGRLADDATPALTQLLREDRHAEALAQLQSGVTAEDAGQESRRDLLRQRVPGADTTLRCRSDRGAESARLLCRMLQGWQAGEGLPLERVQAWAQALRAEGEDPVPWLQTLGQLPRRQEQAP
jgi:hypothetical protein